MRLDSDKIIRVLESFNLATAADEENTEELLGDQEETMESFLPEWLVMIDCEMTGVLPKRDALLQVAALKLRLDLESMQYVEEGDPYLAYLEYSGSPTTDFHLKYLSEIFAECNISKITPEDVKYSLHEWLGDLKGQVMPVGDCVPTDIAFLYEKGCIEMCDYDADGNPVPGTFHYEFWELNPIKDIARTLAGKKFEVPGINKEGVHDALVDCQNQLLELNYYVGALLAG